MDLGFAPLERMTGIEPAQAAWKAAGLPLTYIRISILLVIARRRSRRPPEGPLLSRLHQKFCHCEEAALCRRRGNLNASTSGTIHLLAIRLPAYIRPSVHTPISHAPGCTAPHPDGPGRFHFRKGGDRPCLTGLEQATGFEPATAAWEAAMFPLHHACICLPLEGKVARSAG